MKISQIPTFPETLLWAPPYIFPSKMDCGMDPTIEAFIQKLRSEKRY